MNTCKKFYKDCKFNKITLYFSDIDINWERKSEDIMYNIYLNYGKNPNKYMYQDKDILDIGKHIEVYNMRGIQIPKDIKIIAKKKVDEIKSIYLIK